MRKELAPFELNLHSSDLIRNYTGNLYDFLSLVFRGQIGDEKLLVDLPPGVYNARAIWKETGTTSIGKRADPNSVRPGTRPISRYTGRVSG